MRIVGEALAGETYREQTTVSPIVGPNTPTGPDRTTPWNDGERRIPPLGRFRVPHRQSFRRLLPSTNTVQNPTLGQSWAGKRTWNEDERNEQTPIEVQESALEMISGERGSAAAGVTDIYAPRTNLFPKALGDIKWFLDELRVGDQPFADMTSSELGAGLGVGNIKIDRGLSTPWSEEDRALVQVVGAPSGEICTFTDRVS